MKALLHKVPVRTKEALWTAIGVLVGLVTPDECTSVFAAAGGDAD